VFGIRDMQTLESNSRARKTVVKIGLVFLAIFFYFLEELVYSPSKRYYSGVFIRLFANANSLKVYES
jgi:hypothetical protein